MRKWIGVSAFILLLAFFVLPWRPVFGQATSGYTKIASVNFGTNTYSDTAVVTGDINNYEITAQNAKGESGPSNIITLTTPSGAGPHSNTLTWTPGSGGGTPTTYNVYRLSVTIPNPPTGLVGVSN